MAIDFQWIPIIFYDFQYPGPPLWPLISTIFDYFLWFSIIFTDFQCPWTHIWPICAPYMAQMKGHGSHILPMCGPYMAPIWSKNHCGWNFFHLQPSPAPAPGMPWPAPSHQPAPSMPLTLAWPAPGMPWPAPAPGMPWPNNKNLANEMSPTMSPPLGVICYYCRGVDSLV